MNVSLLILFVLLIVYFSSKIWLRLWDFLRILKFSKSLQGPGLTELIEQTKKTNDLLSWLTELRKRYGTRFRIWLASDLVVFFSDPEDIKIILNSNKIQYKSINYKSLQECVGNGLLTSGGELWHKRRKMLTPAFHFKVLGRFKQPIEDNCNILIEKLSQKANGEAFDIYPFLKLFSLDIIYETAMGIKQNAQLQSTSEYVTAVETICKIGHKQSYTQWEKIPLLYRLTKDYKEKQHALGILHGETKRVIQIRKKALKESKILSSAQADNIDESGVKRRLAFLDLLLLAQEEGADLTDNDIKDEVDTFLAGGHDTVSAALSYVIYILSLNPIEQQKVYEEVVALDGKENESMKYLEAVIQETMRLYPPGPFFGRMITEDTKIRDLILPKGTSVTILACVLFRDEKYFPEPDKFNPDRFLANERYIHPYAFIPFSAGRRNCIGQKFAMLELKCGLANILRAYKILPVDGFVPQLLPEIVMRSENGIQVRLQKR